MLADDNFASIVAAVREGRGIFDNIRKTLVYLLAGNIAELAVMLVAALAGLPLPLLPLQLLWINLVTDGLPALALVMDPTDAGRHEPPAARRRPSRSSAGPEWTRDRADRGAARRACTLGVFVWALRDARRSPRRAASRSPCSCSASCSARSRRAARRGCSGRSARSATCVLLAVVTLSVTFQLVIHSVPWTRELFQIDALSPPVAALCLIVGLVPVTVVELAKLVRRP